MKIPFLTKKVKHKDRPSRLLLSVHGGEHLSDGMIDFDIDVEIDGVKKHYPYTYVPGDEDPITIQLTEWLRRNKATADKFPVRKIVVSANDVKLEANRRISAIIPRWKVERALTGGKPISAADQEAAQAIRNASNRLERQSPIPLDYTDDKHWS
jgi:hypothetical protein